MRRAKVVLIVLFAFVAATAFNVGHAIDAFLPKHVAAGYEIATTNEIPANDLTAEIPGFHAFVAVLFLVLRIDPLGMVHFPIQLVPYVAVFFTLVYLVSNGNAVLAGLLTGLQLFINSSATWRLYLWPHGLGDVLLFTAVVCLLLVFRKRTTRRLYPIALACSIAVVYVSYNETAILALLLGSLYVVLRVLATVDSGLVEAHVDRRDVRDVLPALAIPMGVAVATSEFFHRTFVPILTSGVREDNIYRFFFTWFDVGGSDAGEISHMLVTEPPSIVYLAFTRYAVISIGFLLFFASLAETVRAREEVGHVDVLLLSLLGGMGIYTLLRLFVGSISIGELYLPGVLAFAYLYPGRGGDRDRRLPIHPGRAKTVVVVALVVLAGSIVGTQVVNNTASGIDRNLDQVYAVDGTQEWIDAHARGSTVRSDEYTLNLLVYREMLDADDPAYRETREGYELIRPAEAAALTTGENPGANGCFVLNNGQGGMSLQNWQIIRPWEDFSPRVHTNGYVEKMYTDGERWVFCG